MIFFLPVQGYKLWTACIYIIWAFLLYVAFVIISRVVHALPSIYVGDS